MKEIRSIGIKESTKYFSEIARIMYEEWSSTSVDEWKNSLKDVIDCIETHGGAQWIVTGQTGVLGYTSAVHLSDKILYLYYLIVRKERRGNGLGRRLIETVKNYMKKNNFSHIILDTFSDCVFGFYIKNGFRAVKNFVLTFPDIPPSYLMIYSSSSRTKIDGSFLKEVIKLLIEKTYSKEEIETYSTLFFLTQEQIRIGEEYTLTDKPFLIDERKERNSSRNINELVGIVNKISGRNIKIEKICRR